MMVIMTGPDSRRWRRQTSYEKIERTWGPPFGFDWVFKRGTDAPLTRRGRLLWGALIAGIVAAGAVLVGLSR